MVKVTYELATPYYFGLLKLMKSAQYVSKYDKLYKPTLYLIMV